MSTVNPFAGTKDAKGFDNGVYLPADFVGVLEIKRCILKKTRGNKNLYIVECTILESNLPTAHPVGAPRSWSQDRDTDGAGRAMQDFACAVMGVDRKADPESAVDIVNEVDELLRDSLCPVDHKQHEGKGAWNGLKVRVTTWGKETKKGKEKAAAQLMENAKRGVTTEVVVDKFTVHDFLPYEA